MTEVEIIAIGKETIKTVLLVSAPTLAMALLVGLLVSIFQATTQIQEQTLTFIPKIVAVLVSIILFGSWMLRNIVGFGEQILKNINAFIT